MEIFTIKVSSKTDSDKLRKTIKQLTSAQVSLIVDDLETEDKGGAINELRRRVNKSRKSVSEGRFVTHEELKKISSQW